LFYIGVDSPTVIEQHFGSPVQYVYCSLSEIEPKIINLHD